MVRVDGAIGVAVLLLTFCGAGRILEAAAVGETVKLEYKLTPGMELRYKNEGSIKQKATTDQGEISAEGTISCDTRLIVADVDAQSGLILLGELSNLAMRIKATTPQGEQEMPQDLAMARILRMDLTGKASPRKEAEGDADGMQRSFMGLIRGQLGKKTLQGVSLPPGRVKVGATWESEVDGMGFPLPCQAACTLSEIRDVDGRKCALIKGSLSAAEQIAPADLKGEMETLFDMDRGISLTTTMKVTMTHDQPSIQSAAQIDITATLESLSVMPPDEAARQARIIRALDAVVDQVYANNVDEAVKGLDALAAAEGAEDWKRGLEQTLNMVRQLQTVTAQLSAMKSDVRESKPSAAEEPAEETESVAMKLYKEAKVHADAGELEEAVAAYLKVASSTDEDAAPRIKVLAQHRAAGLLEKLGRATEALAAYQAVEKIAADDAYSGKIKEKARQRAAELAGGAE